MFKIAYRLGEELNKILIPYKVKISIIDNLTVLYEHALLFLGIETPRTDPDSRLLCMKDVLHPVVAEKFPPVWHKPYLGFEQGYTGWSDYVRKKLQINPTEEMLAASQRWPAPGKKAESSCVIF